MGPLGGGVVGAGSGSSEAFGGIRVGSLRKKSVLLVIRVPKAACICSKRRATSRPRCSLASVITEKFGEHTSTHCDSAAKERSEWWAAMIMRKGSTRTSSE
jgi:hypothetical protein